MHTKSFAPLALGLFGIFLGAILGIHDERFAAHFGQRLREKADTTIATMEQKRAVQERFRHAAPAAGLHEAARSFPMTYPVSLAPNWGALQTSSQWNRPYNQIPLAEFVPIPTYDLQVLTFPMRALDPKNPDDIPLITAKLYYSTRFFSRYDLNAGEFTGPHAGIDLKLPRGTPIGAIADGTVHAVQSDDRLGLFVILRHRHPIEGTLFSIYGHLGETALELGQSVRAGERIGTVGTSGYTSGPHLHLQIDRPMKSGGTHTPFLTYTIPRPEEIDQWTLHPIRLIEKN